MSKLSIQGWSSEIIMRPGQKILDAALGAGAPVPFSCMAGECGTCKCRLVAGQVEHGPHSPDALSEHERASGMILACCSRAASEHVVLSLESEAQDAAQQHVVKVLEAERANHDVLRLRLGFAGPAPSFRAGQFARLRFAGMPTRSYSMANVPGEAQWEFHVRHVPGGAVSSHVFQQVQVGDELTLQGPFGSACWDEASPAPLLLVAGGTGLAPIMSVLRTALAAGQRIEALYHGVRAAPDLYDVQALSQLAREHNFRLVPVFSSGEAEAPLARIGFVHQILGHDFASLHGYRIFVAGPPPMVDAVKTLALSRGALPEQVHADAFHAQSSAEPESARPMRFWERLRDVFKRAV